MQDLVSVKFKFNKKPDFWAEHHAVAKAWSEKPAVTESQQQQLDEFKL